MKPWELSQKGTWVFKQEQEMHDQQPCAAATWMAPSPLPSRSVAFALASNSSVTTWSCPAAAASVSAVCPCPLHESRLNPLPDVKCVHALEIASPCTALPLLTGHDSDLVATPDGKESRDGGDAAFAHIHSTTFKHPAFDAKCSIEELCWSRKENIARWSADEHAMQWCGSVSPLVFSSEKATCACMHLSSIWTLLPLPLWWWCMRSESERVHTGFIRFHKSFCKSTCHISMWARISTCTKIAQTRRDIFLSRWLLWRCWVGSAVRPPGYKWSPHYERHMQTIWEV